MHFKNVYCFHFYTEPIFMRMILLAGLCSR